MIVCVLAKLTAFFSQKSMEASCSSCTMTFIPTILSLKVNWNMMMRILREIVHKFTSVQINRYKLITTITQHSNSVIRI